MPLINYKIFMNNIYDVIVIGAGLSGLVAAHTMLDKVSSLDLLVLEAKERIGGRTLSVPLKVKNDKTCFFDIGAHWFSSSQSHLIRYLDLLNLTPVLQKRGGKAIGTTSKKSFESFVEHPIIGNIFTVYELKWFFAWLEKESQRYTFEEIENKFMVDFYDAISMDCFINSKMYTKTAKNIMNNIVKSTTGVDSSKISVMFYLLLCHSSLGFTNQYMTEDGGGREFWIQEGAQEICKRLQKLLGEGVIQLGEPVIEINYSNPQNMIIITSTGKQFICANLICAIPPKEVFEIKFVPGLRRIKKFVLEQINVGHLVKFIITYKKAFWIAKGYSGQIFSCEGGPISVCYDATKDDNPALIGYIKEPMSSNFQTTSNGNYKESVIMQLAKYWGEEALNPIDYCQNSWWDENYIGGCPMTCPGLGNMKWYFSLSQPLNRIHWAGAETATEWSGHMNGAVQAGHRAAVNILYDIRPQSLTYQDIIYLNTRQTHRIRFENINFIDKYRLIYICVGCFLIYRFGIKRLISK